jgi:chaperone modulatory protein CbpM
MTFSRIEFIALARINPQTLDVWIEEEWVVPQDASGAAEFTESDLARAQLIHDLAHDLGVNAEGVGVVLRLVDQVHDLRNALADLAARTRRSAS